MGAGSLRGLPRLRLSCQSGYIDAEHVEHLRSGIDFEASVENDWTSVVAVTTGPTDPMLPSRD
jgi:hypothetical protein